MTVYVENLKNQQKTLGTNKWLQQGGRTQGHNVQKSVAFLCTNNEQIEFEIKNTTPFILAPPPK